MDIRSKHGGNHDKKITGIDFLSATSVHHLACFAVQERIASLSNAISNLGPLRESLVDQKGTSVVTAGLEG
jgi:hypothetical protein